MFRVLSYTHALSDSSARCQPVRRARSSALATMHERKEGYELLPATVHLARVQSFAHEAPLLVSCEERRAARDGGQALTCLSRLAESEHHAERRDKVLFCCLCWCLQVERPLARNDREAALRLEAGHPAGLAVV